MFATDAAQESLIDTDPLPMIDPRFPAADYPHRFHLIAPTD